MSNFVQVIQACEQASGEGSKLAIREALATVDQIAYRLIWEGLNKYRVYHVKKFDMPKDIGLMHVPRDPTFELFFGLLDKLATRELTGNAARDAITATLAFHDEETAKYLARIIDHDLDAGFSADTFNNVLIARELGGDLDERLKEISKALKVKGIRQYSHLQVFPLLVPTFEVQLADKHETEEDFANQEYPCQADVKYDGERNIAIMGPDGIGHFSRSGNEAHHMYGVADEELQWMREELGYDFILDGERMADDFTATMNAKKSGSDKSGMRIHAYFLMPLSHWMTQETDITMAQSRATLGALLEKMKTVFPNPKIILSLGRIVKDHQDMMNFCNEVIDGRGPTGKPEEGLILKKLNDVYRWERNSAWTKVKRFYPVDLRVIGWYYGKKGSRLESVMGGVIVEGVDEKGKKIRTRIGSGFNDADRAQPAKWQEATIEAKYQEMTQSATAKKSKSDIHQLRFPTIERVRDDKDVEALHDGRYWAVSLEEAVKICGA